MIDEWRDLRWFIYIGKGSRLPLAVDVSCGSMTWTFLSRLITFHDGSDIRWRFCFNPIFGFHCARKWTLLAKFYYPLFRGFFLFRKFKLETVILILVIPSVISVLYLWGVVVVVLLYRIIKKIIYLLYIKTFICWSKKNIYLIININFIQNTFSHLLLYIKMIQIFGIAFSLFLSYP
jgi:hypothetical protein